MTVNRTLSKYQDSNKTKQQILPYSFRMTATGKLCITNTRGQILVVTYGQVVNTLQDPELDVHRRRMYEAAKELFEKDQKVQ